MLYYLSDSEYTPHFTVLPHSNLDKLLTLGNADSEEPHPIRVLRRLGSLGFKGLCQTLS